MALGPLLQPTKWYGLKLWPYKMVLPVNCLGSFSSTTIVTCSSKTCQTCAFCRASTSPGTRLKLPFFPLPFCRAKPCQLSFLDEAGSCFMQLLQADKVDIFVPTMCWQSFCKLTLPNAQHRNALCQKHQVREGDVHCCQVARANSSFSEPTVTTIIWHITKHTHV